MTRSAKQRMNICMVLDCLRFIKLRNNLKTFTLEELKREVIKMKHLNFDVTRTKRFQVEQPMINCLLFQSSTTYVLIYLTKPVLSV